MGWSTPYDGTTGETITETIWDVYLKDNLYYLKGLSGVVTIQSGLTIDNSLGTERLLLPLLSTAECTTALNAEGKIAHDEDTHRVKVYLGAAGLYSVVSTADVDDTPVNGATTDPVSSNWAYDFINILTTAGDIIYATAAGVWAKLGIGTAGQRLSVKAGATAPEWQTAPGLVMGSGNYTGNETVNRPIPHGVGAVPRIVLIMEAANVLFYRIMEGLASIIAINNTISDSKAVTTPDATNFFVGNAGSYIISANQANVVYYWTATG